MDPKADQNRRQDKEEHKASYDIKADREQKNKEANEKSQNKVQTEKAKYTSTTKFKSNTENTRNQNLKNWRHKELEGDITQHQTEATNWQDKTSGRAEAKYTDTDDETRNRWAGAAGEMMEGNHRGNNSGR